MKQYRSFDYDVPDPTEEGPAFDLAGEHFRCVAVAPVGALAAFLDGIIYDEHGKQLFRTPVLIKFVDSVLIDQVWVPETTDEDGVTPGRFDPADDAERWQALVMAKDNAFPAELLGEVVLWLANIYLERPTN